MPPPHLSQYSPLHTGRSFICYRDVNRAIEKHREIYGLRLVLKKAVKLENYCLTVDQMRDLNFRLKYGQLDYQCSVDNGRPGRPGNDERCPRLVRLRLSPDARTLVVYDTHVHDTPPKPFPGVTQVLPPTPKGLSPPCPVPEPITVLSPPSLVSMSQVQETPPQQSTPISTLSPTPIYSSPHLSITPIESPHTPIDTHHTPNSSLSSHEKITVKLKKSQFSPNEMVVVGSARHAQEQLELRNSPEKTPGTPGGFASPDKVMARQHEQQVARQQHQALARQQHQAIARQQHQALARQQQQVAHRYPDGSYTVSKVVRRSPVRPEKTGTSPSERPPGRPLNKQPMARGEKVARAPLRLPPPGRSGDKVGARLGATAYSNGTSHTNGVRALPTKRVPKKKRAKQTDPSFDLSMLTPLDTELGVSEKQQLAHGVLLRLLRVTSQLPMIQFSHALDTLETLTDAYKLEQRVNLTISHDHEEESEMYPHDSYEVVDLEGEEVEEEGSSGGASDGYQYDDTVSSTTYDHRLAITQVDGACDELDAAWVGRGGGEKRPVSGWCEGGEEEEEEVERCQSLSSQLTQGWKVARSSH
ncbi:uncharacterized protein LOC127000892 [Eriocheir sinensis]|uniref:uncharacterized protein LOC127000892 n=1 Tax=Eriocheir sinensis TaxID=95602 RepID=UPI0021CA96C3|nr:uncharacterized protein LOC127000892 [Eriocheir sinensis]